MRIKPCVVCFLAQSRHAAMSDLSPLCEAKRTSALLSNNPVSLGALAARGCHLFWPFPMPRPYHRKMHHHRVAANKPDKTRFVLGAFACKRYLPRITDCRRCIDSCFCLCESPSMVFGPIAIGPACISLPWKREAISRCARSLQRSASPSHFQLSARSETARCLHNNSISRQPDTMLLIATPEAWGSLRLALLSRFDPLEFIMCFKNDATADLTCCDPPSSNRTPSFRRREK
jgi:hypothetical protein